MSEDARAEWLARMLASTLELELQSAEDLIGHASPEVLVTALPAEHLTRVLARALDTGVMSPKHIVDTAGIEILAAHLPAEVTWASVVESGLRAGLGGAAPADRSGLDFLRTAIDLGLDLALIDAAQVVRHAHPEVLTRHLPAEVAARLLGASLAAGRMTPDLIVDTVGTETLAKHLPAAILWACVCEAGEALGGAGGAVGDTDLDLGASTQDEAPGEDLELDLEAEPEGDDDPLEEATMATSAPSAAKKAAPPRVSKASSALLDQARRRARLGAADKTSGK